MIPTRVLAAQVMPAIEPSDASFTRVMGETGELLKRVFQTRKDVAFFPGSGRVTIEFALASVIERGDKVLALATGSKQMSFLQGRISAIS